MNRPTNNEEAIKAMQNGDAWARKTAEIMIANPGMIHLEARRRAAIALRAGK